jgi:hypothetical protein
MKTKTCNYKHRDQDMGIMVCSVRIIISIRHLIAFYIFQYFSVSRNILTILHIVNFFHSMQMTQPIIFCSSGVFYLCRTSLSVLLYHLVYFGLEVIPLPRISRDTTTAMFFCVSLSITLASNLGTPSVYTTLDISDYITL